MAIPSQDLKTCTKCGLEKPLSEFYMRSPPATYLQAECKACTTKRSKAWRTKYIDLVLSQEHKRAKERRAEIKDQTFMAYGGYQCACCGETERIFLTLDHVNNDGAAFRRKIAGKQARGGGQVTYRWLMQNGFPPGYQILCANCNYGKRMNGGICPHQVRRNDQAKAVGRSRPKPHESEQSDYDMVSPAVKAAAV